MSIDYSANWRTPSPTASLGSSQSGRFDMFNVKNISHPQKTKHPKQKNKKPLDLWGDVNGWIPFYRCTSCRQVMSRKEPSKRPQVIYSCGHIVCANCIVKSYLVELDPCCPVSDCDKCVNPKYKEPTQPLSILSENPHKVTESLLDDCDFCGGNNDCSCQEEILPGHYCGDWICPGNCGLSD